jgi:hypothetical protein
MVEGPPFIRARILAVFGCALAACAGPAPPPDATAGREEQRELLAKTTPTAAGVAAQAGPGAPVADGGAEGRPGRLLVYSAITGHVPLEEKADRDPNDPRLSPAEREAARARSIESEIEEELSKQEELSAEETSGSAAPPTPDLPDLGADPMSAPPAPQPRALPESLFESQPMTIPAGAWQNPRTLEVVRRSLDADRDGKPEELRYLDATSGALVRRELDRDFDGQLDAWISYQGGEPVTQVLDENGDGRLDAWESYANDLLAARAVDTDADGVQDVFYRYEGGDLVQKRADRNNDGTVDRTDTFRERRRQRTEEDRDLDGVIETWTTWGAVDGREVVVRIERDSRARGKPDVFETYETVGGETRIARREEDLNGDGTIDVVSTYEGGKLVQRAISDEALSPL